MREMHQEGRSHGSVDPAHVMLRPGGAILLPFDPRGYPDPLADLVGFGVVLYAMLTGKQPSGDELRLVPAKPAHLKGASALRAAATRLAERCPTAGTRDRARPAKDPDRGPPAQRDGEAVGRRTAAIRIPAPPPPVTFPPPQPLAVYAGKAAPIINPPTAGPPPPPVVDSVVEPLDPARRPLAPNETRQRIALPTGPAGHPLPKCKEFHVRLSRPRTRFERFLNLLGMGVHRCHRLLLPLRSDLRTEDRAESEVAAGTQHSQSPLQVSGAIR